MTTQVTNLIIQIIRTSSCPSFPPSLLFSLSPPTHSLGISSHTPMLLNKQRKRKRRKERKKGRQVLRSVSLELFVTPLLAGISSIHSIYAH